MIDKVAVDVDDLEKSVRTILLIDWDPIRLQELSEAYRISNKDEYDRYVEAISGMIADGSEQRDLEKYLFDIETQTMGLKPNDSRAAVAARALHKLETGYSSHD